MAVRLNKALKELNVGINTVAEFLQKKGASLQDAAPNAKITDEQYAMLVKEFGKDKNVNANPQANIEDLREPEQKVVGEHKLFQKKQEFKIVGNINDLRKTEVDSKSDSKENIQQQNGVQFKQVDFIDLSSLNPKTRLGHKSKSEHQKDSFEKQQQKQKDQNTQDDNKGNQPEEKGTSMEVSYIKFNNFRRFTNFPKLELGKVNMFVGKNNSGKSTTVKGMLLMMNFLKDGIWAKGQIFPYFSFGGDICVASFGRALNVNAHERKISFGIGIGEFSFDVVVTGENDSPIGNVTKIVCDYKDGEYIFSFDFIKGFSLVINDKPAVDEDKLKVFQEEKQKLERLIDDSATSISAAVLYKEQLKSVENYLESNAAKKYEYEIPAERVDTTNGSGYLMESLIRLFCKDNIVPNTSKKNKVLLSRANVINSIAKNFNEAIRKINIERVYSHSASQTTVFNVNDRNDYVAQCIHGFAEQRISQEKGDLEYAILTKWMDKFEIGVGYSINSVENEAYTLKIKGQDGSLINLGDKGKGSIQVMTLLMRLITISKKYRLLGENVVVLVEEPEQNLHPKTQSFLADLFYDFSVYYGLSFIIETHSEYLIRRNQIIVARGIKEGDFTINSCPIKVTYFPLNAPVYNMPFMYNGHFARFFESGFFDEASLLANEVLSYEEEPQIDDEE